MAYYMEQMAYANCALAIAWRNCKVDGLETDIAADFGSHEFAQPTINRRSVKSMTSASSRPKVQTSMARHSPERSVIVAARETHLLTSDSAATSSAVQLLRRCRSTFSHVPSAVTEIRLRRTSARATFWSPLQRLR